MKDQTLNNNNQPYTLAGLFTLSLRIVAGWTYFSAFWRRLILENKLDPEGPGYIGEKFNHFLPNALGIGPFIEYLVTHEELLWWFMLSFTIIEAVVGLLFMLGLFTRLVSISVFTLALGILLSAGWLGTTCLDEWQIGILGMAAGFTIFLSGGGKYALDYVIQNKNWQVSSKSWLNWLSSGALPIGEKKLTRIALSGTFLIVFATLFTNQYFHGGVWGKLHNLSVRPHITISKAQLNNQQLSFTIFRDEGADVYGSFLIGITLKDYIGHSVLHMNSDALSKIETEAIQNEYVTKIKPGKHSLVIPLGAKATITLKEPVLQQLERGTYLLELTDVSGLTWTQKINFN